MDGSMFWFAKRTCGVRAIHEPYPARVLEYIISVVVNFDDIIIFSKTLEEHWKHVSEALRKLRERSVNLKINKCEFAVRRRTTRMQEEKVRAILE